MMRFLITSSDIVPDIASDFVLIRERFPTVDKDIID